MNRVFVHYEKWECYKNGMWRKVSLSEEDDFLIKATNFTGDHNLYGNAMMRVINEWPLSCSHHLSDLSINRRAYIGHAACSLEINCPEYITRMAWHLLNDNQRILANKMADLAILKWEQNNIFKHEQTIIEF